MRTLGKMAFVASMVVILAGCTEPKTVTGEEFMAMHARNPESMRHSQFMGVKDGKAVLKVSEMSIVSKKKWKDTYFVTDATNLPADWLLKNKPVDI